MDLPKALVDEQIQQLQIDLMQRMGRNDASQIPPREPFEEPARRRVSLGLIVGELVRREGLKADREKIFARLEELAAAYPDPDQMRQAYLQTDAMRQSDCGREQAGLGTRKARVTDRPTRFADLTGFADKRRSPAMKNAPEPGAMWSSASAAKVL